MKPWIKRSLFGLFGLSVAVGGLTACGHRHDGPGWQMSAEEQGRFREKMIDRVATRLELNADQKQRLGVVADKLREQRLAVMGQGGDPRVIDDYTRLPAAPDRRPLSAAGPGYVATIDAESVGRAAVALGAGRAALDDVVDPGVGIEVLTPVGTAVSAGAAMLMVHHRGGRGLEEALALLAAAVTIADAPPEPVPLIVERIGQGGRPEAPEERA